MRIAVPLSDGRLADHFGHASRFAIFTIDPEQKRIEDEEILEAPPHEPGRLPAWLHQFETNVVLARGMGSRAHQLFAEHGIEVVVGVEETAAREAAAAYLAGSLRSGPNRCDH
jgi:predicted Fe-Mo cluster-binding NifX family protein